VTCNEKHADPLAGQQGGGSQTGRRWHDGGAGAAGAWRNSGARGRRRCQGREAQPPDRGTAIRAAIAGTKANRPSSHL